jgi:hypothetical protein
MSRSVYIKDGATWKNFQRAIANDAGVWKYIKEIWVNQSTIWRLVYQAIPDEFIVCYADYNRAPSGSIETGLNGYWPNIHNSLIGAGGGAASHNHGSVTQTNSGTQSNPYAARNRTLFALGRALDSQWSTHYHPNQGQPHSHPNSVDNKANNWQVCPTSGHPHFLQGALIFSNAVTTDTLWATIGTLTTYRRRFIKFNTSANATVEAGSSSHFHGCFSAGVTGGPIPSTSLNTYQRNLFHYTDHTHQQVCHDNGGTFDWSTSAGWYKVVTYAWDGTTWALGSLADCPIGTLMLSKSQSVSLFGWSKVNLSGRLLYNYDSGYGTNQSGGFNHTHPASGFAYGNRTGGREFECEGGSDHRITSDGVAGHEANSTHTHASGDMKPPLYNLAIYEKTA